MTKDTGFTCCFGAISGTEEKMKYSNKRCPCGSYMQEITRVLEAVEKDQIYISYSKIQYYTLACPLCPQDAVKTSSIASHTMTLKQDGVSSHEVSFCTREKGRSFPKSAQVYFLQSHWSELRHMALLSCKKAWGESISASIEETGFDYYCRKEGEWLLAL